MDDARESSRDHPQEPESTGAGRGQLTVPPWVQLVGLPLLVLLGYVFIRAASHAVIVFLIAGLISLLLAPVVRTLARRGVPRLLSVLVVFGIFAAIVTVVSLAAVDVLANQSSRIAESAQDVGAVALDRIDSIQSFVDERGWRFDVRDQGVRFVEQLQERSTEVSAEALTYGREFVTVIAEAAFNLVLIVVITIYMLLDAPRISRMVAAALPANSGVEGLFGRMERQLLRYTVGQSLASLVMGTSATVGLWCMGKTGIWDAADEYAVLFGLIVAITEFAPSIGPAIGSIPPIVTASFDGIGPAIAVALFFVLLHQIEGHIVIPKLMGAAIAVHPLLVIFGILAGAQMLGIGGILLALPLLAVGREVLLFLRERIALTQWPTPVPAALLGGLPTSSGTLAADMAAAGATSPPSRADDTPRRVSSRVLRTWAQRRAHRDDPEPPAAGS